LIYYISYIVYTIYNIWYILYIYIYEYPFPPTICSSTAFITYSISCTYIDITCLDTVDSHLLFLSLHPEFQYYKHFLQVKGNMVMFVFYKCLSFVSIFLTWEKTFSHFWAWFTSLSMMSCNCIHLPSNHIVSFFLVAEEKSIVSIYTTLS
jgi:hypothetical protein